MLAPFATSTRPGSLPRQIVYRWRDSNDYQIFHPRDYCDEVPSNRRERTGFVTSEIPIPADIGTEDE